MATNGAGPDINTSEAAAPNGSGEPSTGMEWAEVIRDLTVTPLMTGMFQGFFSVGVQYLKERRAEKKAAQEALAAKAEAEAEADKPPAASGCPVL